MKDTIVTAIYHSSPYSRMGGRNYDFSYYKAPFRNLLSLDCNIVVFSHDHLIKNINDFFNEHKFTNFKIIDFDLNSYINSDKIYQLKEDEGIIDVNGLKSNRLYIANDRNHHLCLLKTYFLKNSIENKYFDSENHYWVDGGLFHHGIFPETHGGIEKLIQVKEEKYWPNNQNNICNPNLIERLKTKNNTGLIFIGIDNYYAPTSWFENYTDLNKITHVVGGFFGGKNEFILELHNDFNELTTKILHDGYLTLEEEVLSILYSVKYNKFGYISFETWYHDVPSVPNYFGTTIGAKSFYKVFI